MLLSSLAQNYFNFRTRKERHLRFKTNAPKQFRAHTAVVPTGIIKITCVQIANFKKAVNISVQKHAHAKASFFPPYTWQVATCGRCHSALGWLMKKPSQDEPTKPSMVLLAQHDIRQLLYECVRTRLIQSRRPRRRKPTERRMRWQTWVFSYQNRASEDCGRHMFGASPWLLDS